MLRWTLRILLALLILTVVAAGIVQLVLRSAWLGERVLAQASARLGLEVSAKSFTTGWRGVTALTDLTVRMPPLLPEAQGSLDAAGRGAAGRPVEVPPGEVILAADRLRLRHTGVVPLLFGWPLRVRSVELDHPTVDLREDKTGRWNAQDAWARIEASIAPRGGDDRSMLLPRIVVHQAVVRITAADGKTQTVSTIEFAGRAQERLLWRFDLQAPPLVNLAGRLSPGGDWSHEVVFTARELGPLVGAVSERPLTPVEATGRWAGRVQAGALDGTLTLGRLALGSLVVQGAAQIATRPEGIVIEPRGLELSEPNIAREPVQLADGTVEVSREQVAWSALAAKSGVFGAQTDGHWDWAAGRGESSGSWTAAWPERSARYDGTWRASLGSPPEGRKEGAATVTAQAQTPFGFWHVRADVQGAGTTWQASQWQIRVPTAAWSRGERRVDVTDVTALVDLQWPAIELTALGVPQAQRARATARFDAETRRWSAQLALEKLRLEILGPSGLDLHLSAEGDERAARIAELRLAQSEKVVTAKGEVSFLQKDLRAVHVAADWPASGVSPGPTSVPASAGRWHLETDIEGPMQPLALSATGTLKGQNVMLGKRRVERVEIPVHARVDARQIRLAAEPFDLLGGQWQWSGRYQFAGRWTRLRVTATDLSLEAAASMAGLSFASRGRGQAEVQLEMPGFDLHQATAAGSWNAQDIDIPPFAAEQARGSLRIADGLVRIEDIQLEQEGGTGQAGLEFRLDQPQVLSADLRTEAWPLHLARGSWTVRADAQAKLRLDVVKRTADGEARVAGQILWDDRMLGDLNLAAAVQGRTLDVRELHAAGLGGTLDGTAHVLLDRWTSSVARLHWEGIEPHRLAAWRPGFESFQGLVSGVLTVEPTQGQPRAPEPLRLVLDVNTAEARFGTAAIEGGRLVGYLGPARLLLDESRLRVLGGLVRARGRISAHPGQYFGLVTVDANDLNLDSLVHVFAPQAGAYAGLLSANVTVLPVFPRGGTGPGPAAPGGGSHPAEPAPGTRSFASGLSGTAHLRLTQSDLVNNSIVRTLYDTLSLRFGKQEPTGTGEIQVRLEGPAAVISSFSYFNRGVEIRGAGTIAEFARGGASPLTGYAVASTHVLQGLPVPGVASLDRLLSSFQTGAASVRIAGTLAHAQVNVVPLPEVLGAFRNLLWAQLRE
jgi:hypothetical protein